MINDTEIEHMMMEAKECGFKELHQLFTRIATIIADDGSETAILVDDIEPLLERFISEFYPDVELRHIMTFLWVWFAHWRDRRGDWQTPAACRARAVSHVTNSVMEESND